MGQVLGATLREAARRFGARPAFVAPEGWTLDYAGLDRLVDEVGAGLAAEGLAPGEVVALVLPSGPEYLVAYLAAARLGATTAGVNPRLPAAERAALVDVVRPSLVLGTSAMLEGMPAAVASVEVGQAARPRELSASLPTADPDRRSLPTSDAAATALVFTSGTTGRPKAAVFGDAQLEAIRRIDHGEDWGGGGHMLVATELPHVGFMTKLAWYLRAGMTLGLLRHWRAHDALVHVARHGVRVVGGIPAQVALMLREPDFDAFDLSAVTTIVTGGAAVPPALLEEAARRFDAGFSVRYSSTESGGVGTATDPRDLTEGRTSVGRPRTGVEVRVVDEDWQPVATGAPGRVVLRSGATMQRYWGNVDDTAAVLRDGWLATGDIGWLDDARRLHLSGRDSEMYVRGGYNVHPQRVESVLAGHPAVASVVVVPRPSEVMGDIGVAVVVPRDPEQPPTLADLRDHAEHRLARHELPEALVIVARLPLTSMHKVDRPAARRLAATS